LISATSIRDSITTSCSPKRAASGLPCTGVTFKKAPKAATKAERKRLDFDKPEPDQSF
jgi:hypothetical protein